MEYGALAVSIISIIVAAWSILYARSSARSSKRSADVAEESLDLEKARLQAEAERVEFTTSRDHDVVHVTQIGNGTAHRVTFSRNLQPVEGPSPETWTKGTSFALWLIPPTMDDPELIAPTVSWTTANDHQDSQPLEVHLRPRTT